MRLGRRVAAVCLLLAVFVCACGPPPPQAPFADQKKLDEALSGISSACGESFQLSAFHDGVGSDFVVLEATAISDAQKLAGVYRRGAGWIYQGETVSDIVKDSLSMLNGCGLRRASAVLAHATGVH